MGVSASQGKRRGAPQSREVRTVNGDFYQQLQGRRLTTAEIVYHIPDHPSLLQEFLWQTLDEAPEFPRIHRFLDHWRREIDAVIHSVQLSYVGAVAPARIQIASDFSLRH